jgi:hypothetical protein
MSGSIRSLSLDATGGPTMGAQSVASGEPERTNSGQRLTRTGSGASALPVVGDSDPAFPHTWPTRTRTPARCGLENRSSYPHRSYNVMLAAASSSTTASAYVIRPDRDMRQFDGSIV